MELQVIIRLSDRVYDLIEGRLPALGRQVEKALVREVGRQVLEDTEITVRAVEAGAEPGDGD